MNNEISLRGKVIAVLATDGFEDSELISPVAAVERAGAEAVIISDKPEELKTYNSTFSDVTRGRLLYTK